jgi:hypothetical protein
MVDLNASNVLVAWQQVFGWLLSNNWLVAEQQVFGVVAEQQVWGGC